MNADLEKTLDEMGAEYRTVVARLRNGREAAAVRRAPGVWRRSSVYLVAASLLVALALSATFRLVRPAAQPAAPAYGAREYHMSVDEMIATQNPDGSWQNDFLTRRNAAALRGVPSARVPYKKAVRYLNTKGLSPSARVSGS